MKRTIKILLSFLIVFAMLFGIIASTEAAPVKAAYNYQFTDNPDTGYTTDSKKIVSWELNFTPVKYEFYRDDVLFSVIENPTSSSFNFSAGTYEYKIKAYFGSRDNAYVECQPFMVNKVDFIIDSITLYSDCSAPKEGMAPYYPRLVSVNGSADNKDYLSAYMCSAEWGYDDEYSTSSESYAAYDKAAFEAGYAYSLNCYYEINGVGVFSEDCTLTMNTLDGTLVAKVVPGAHTTSISFNFFFDVVKHEVHSIELYSDVSEPQNNARLYFPEVRSVNGRTDLKHLVSDKTDFAWYSNPTYSTDPDEYSYFDGDKFIAGYAYDMFCVLYLDDLAAFADDCKITLTTPEGTKNGAFYRQIDANRRDYDFFFEKIATPLTITTQPKNASAADGKNVSVTVKAEGDGVTYQWYIKNKGDSKYSKSSITSNVYQTNMSAEKDGRILQCVIKDKYGNMVKSDVVTITMKNPLKITQQPVNTSAANGETVKVTVKASGDGVTYQWYIKNKGDSKYTKSSITSNVYQTNMTAAKDGRILQCVIKDKYGNMVKSDIVTITIK